MEEFKYSRLGFILSTVLLGALTGCVADGPRHAGGYAQPPPDYVASGVVLLQNQYVYYPCYQVYYISNRREYVYWNDHSWVSRSEPPRVSADLLFASPSVKLAFHDSPSIHHASVVRQYPEGWAPPGSSGNRGQETGTTEKETTRDVAGK
jgi:hypothetical protein